MRFKLKAMQMDRNAKTVEQVRAGNFVHHNTVLHHRLMPLKALLLAAICSLGSLQTQASQQMTPLDSHYNIARGLAPEVQGQKISVLEPFQGEFRILGSKRYTQDEQAKFSPIDYAVTRGLFTRPDIAKQISIRQYDRFLNWQMARPPIEPALATQLVSNMHIIPANPEIAKEIVKVKRGDLVRLSGDLVQIDDQDLVWKSALDWNGIGDGACKLIRVDSIQWLENQNL